MAPKSDEESLFVIVSIADNGVVHAWGTPDGHPFQIRKQAINAANRFKRYNAKMYPQAQIRVSVCKLLEGG